MMIDLIGDIHGHAEKLKELLKALGYKAHSGTYKHSERKVVFVGDYIDRGPKIRETLEIVRSMTESGSAIALMGNHEYNALCFHFRDVEGGHLREHSIKNIIQHYETIKQFHNNQKEYEDYLEWFKSLPLFIETESFRAVHACWDQNHIQFLQKTLDNGRLTDKLIYASVKKGSDLNLAIEDTLKGKELRLPDGYHFHDKDGSKRTEIRIKWWENPELSTYKTLSIESFSDLPEEPLDLLKFKSLNYYLPTEKKVFFGHYWLKGNPSIYKNNICCLDYSIAKGGYLAAYRLGNEVELSNNNFVYV